MNTHLLSLPGRLSVPVELVERLPARVKPSESKIKRYYGRNAPYDVLKAKTIDRLVFIDHASNAEVKYIVVPDTLVNRGYVRPL